MEEALLGGLSPQAFLRRHWQKRPLLVRRALPGFRGAIGKNALFALAGRGEVESRLVERHGNKWQVTHGPLSQSRAAAGRCAQLDAPGERREPLQRACGETAAPLLVHSAGAPGRRDGELRRAGRGGRPACRFLRRIPGAGRRPSPLAARPPPAFRPGCACPAQPDRRFPRRGGVRAGAGGHALPAAGLGARRRRARQLLHLLGRVPRAARRRAGGILSRLPSRTRPTRRDLPRPAPARDPASGKDRRGPGRLRAKSCFGEFPGEHPTRRISSGAS